MSTKMRTLKPICHSITIIVLGILLFLKPAAHAAGPKNGLAVSEVSIYRVAGYSTGTTDGSVDGGIGGLHAYCQEDFGERARACTTEEAALSPNLANLPDNVQEAWVLPVVTATSIIFDNSINPPS